MKKSLLLHTCCAPCLSYVEQRLRDTFTITSYCYNPNIQPYSEYGKRKEALNLYTSQHRITLIEHEYDTTTWSSYVSKQCGGIKEMRQSKEKRCTSCYMHRLEQTAQFAAHNNYHFFSTTLLYSIYQNHETIRSVGESLAHTYGLEFYYEDFRKGWQQGIELYRTTGLYRQKYCGCLISLEERSKQ